jgi:hypothetical protein
VRDGVEASQQREVIGGRVAVSIRMAVAVAVCTALVLAGPSPEPAAAGIQAGGTRTVFASAVTKEGAPITDLTAGDFEVREGGKLQADRDSPSAIVLELGSDARTPLPGEGPRP